LLNTLLLPLVSKKAKVQGQKLLDFQDFRKVANLINKKAHLTIITLTMAEGLNQIRMIRKGMNKGRIFCVTETETTSAAAFVNVKIEAGGIKI
jgi:hypothetical protein